MNCLNISLYWLFLTVVQFFAVVGMAVNMSKDRELMKQLTDTAINNDFQHIHKALSMHFDSIYFSKGHTQLVKVYLKDKEIIQSTIDLYSPEQAKKIEELILAVDTLIKEEIPT